MEGTITLIATLLTLFYIMFARQKPLTEKGFITNTYAYIILGLLISFGTSVLMDRYNLISPSNIGVILIAFIVGLIAMFGIFFSDKNNTITHHILWLIFIIAMGMILFPIYEVDKMSGLLTKSILVTIGVVLVLTLIAYSQPLGVFESWFPFLFVALIGLILVELVDLFIGSPLSTRWKVYSWIAIIIFSGFMLYDTQKLIIKAPQVIQKCLSTMKQHDCADYPMESLGIFLDVMNLFSNISNVSR